MGHTCFRYIHHNSTVCPAWLPIRSLPHKAPFPFSTIPQHGGMLIFSLNLKILSNFVCDVFKRILLLISLLVEASALHWHRFGTGHYMKRWRHSSLTYGTVNHAVIPFQEPNIMQITGEYMSHQHSENWRNQDKSAYYQWYIYGWFTVRPSALIKLHGLFYLHQLPRATNIVIF